MFLLSNHKKTNIFGKTRIPTFIIRTLCKRLKTVQKRHFGPFPARLLNHLRPYLYIYIIQPQTFYQCVLVFVLIMLLYIGLYFCKKQLSTTVANQVQCSSQRDSPPAAGPIVYGRRHPQRKS